VAGTVPGASALCVADVSGLRGFFVFLGFFFGGPGNLVSCTAGGGVTAGLLCPGGSSGGGGGGGGGFAGAFAVALGGTITGGAGFLCWQEQQATAAQMASAANPFGRAVMGAAPARGRNAPISACVSKRVGFRHVRWLFRLALVLRRPAESV